MFSFSITPTSVLFASYIYSSVTSILFVVSNICSFIMFVLSSVYVYTLVPTVFFVLILDELYLYVLVPILIIFPLSHIIVLFL